MSLPPLLPKLDAILVLDNEGQRLAGKYYGSFLSQPQDGKTAQELKKNFEVQLQQKIAGIVARPDAAEVVTIQGKTAVFCGGSGPGAGGDVRLVHVGPSNESELVLAYLCEGMYDGLSQLMGGAMDRAMILENLELVFLLVDEHCDGGLILETDGTKLAGAVFLRDEEPAAEMGGQAVPQSQGMPPGVSTGEMSIGQALRQARDQWLSGGM
eukprot:Nitzschia sp. Nitz4//scaffold106_size73319//7140//7901//NITZ4_005726-RA/size73319-augustus-gene-0.0-mRNA-1//1//CDS//3329532490//2063//frame0